MWATGALSTVTITAGQTLSYTQIATSRDLRTEDLGAGTGDVTALLNTLSGTWATGGSDRNAYARATYSDSMALQGPDNRFQLFNFQLSGSFEFDNRRSLTGDFTWQQTWQEEAARFDGFARLGNARNDSRGASGEIVYRHQRLCGMPRLRFESRLKLAQDVLNQPGTLLSIPDRETKLWENRLDWSVGPDRHAGDPAPVAGGRSAAGSLPVPHPAQLRATEATREQRREVEMSILSKRFAPAVRLAGVVLLGCAGPVRPAGNRRAGRVRRRGDEQLFDAAGMRPVVFPHWFHRIRYRCKVCHADLGFKFKAGGNEINMVKVIDGQFCGACHNGEVAWSIENCNMCHSAKSGTPTQVHESTTNSLVAPAGAKQLLRPRPLPTRRHPPGRKDEAPHRPRRGRRRPHLDRRPGRRRAGPRRRQDHLRRRLRRLPRHRACWARPRWGDAAAWKPAPATSPRW